MDHLLTGLNAQLSFSMASESPTEVRLDMPVTAACMQPFGFVHGGATLTLLEAAASRGAYLRCDYATQRPFGTHMDVHHVKPCREGTVHGVAVLVEEQDLGERGSRQMWEVSATDDAGNLLSTGTFTTHIVSLDYLHMKESASM